MSLQDTATKQYVSEMFADAFNYLIYDGEQVIKPERYNAVCDSIFAVFISASE